MTSINKKEKYEVEKEHKAFYTGGVVEWTEDGKYLLCQCEGCVKVLDVTTGEITSSLGSTEEEEEEDPDIINTFALSSNNELLVTSHRSGLFKSWLWKETKLSRTWKSIHKGPVASVCLNHDGMLMASGGSDSSVRIWDLQHQSCTLNLRGGSGVMSLVKFGNVAEENVVFAAGDDNVIRAWKLNGGEHHLTLSGHFSKVTALVIINNSNLAVSCGRDKVLLLWDLSKQEAIRTLPVFEALESLVLLPEASKFSERAKGVLVATAGEKGLIRIWDVTKGREVFAQQNSLVRKAKEDGGLSIVNLLLNQEKSSLAVVTVDHNIILHNLETFECEKQFVGFSDEILDLVYFGREESHLAIATNSIDIKLYNLSNMNCQLLQGHTDLVLCLATAPHNSSLLISGSKDNSVRLWMMDAEGSSVKCIGVGTRHTSSVGSVGFGHLSASFFVSVSQDSCLKLWQLPKKIKYQDELQTLLVNGTVEAHNKDINIVCVSPNDKLIATGSQDKTAKLWSLDGLTLLGVLRGHRRGVWCVKFSPVDQVLLTCSADCSVKLWALQDLSCAKTLEGHDSSVLRADFLSHGMQIVSVGADGLLKLWDIKTSECVNTASCHDGRIWALTVSADESHLVTGGSDSKLVIWQDVTEQQRLEANKARERQILQQQELANLIKANHLLEALRLSLTLDFPLQTLNIVKEILKQGRSGLEETVKQLQPEQKESLLKCASVWNTNSRNCHPAQMVISILLEEVTSGSIQMRSIEEVLPYTERHFKRLTQLLQDLHYLKYMAKIMGVSREDTDQTALYSDEGTGHEKYVSKE